MIYYIVFFPLQRLLLCFKHMEVLAPKCKQTQSLNVQNPQLPAMNDVMIIRVHCFLEPGKWAWRGRGGGTRNKQALPLFQDKHKSIIFR
jgi:hypothetical protein